MFLIQFPDKMVSYEEFMNDLAARVVEAIRKDEQPKYISQAKAWKMYSRRNVERWLKEEKLHPLRTPGRLEYSVAELNRVRDKAKM